MCNFKKHAMKGKKGNFIFFPLSFQNINFNSSAHCYISFVVILILDTESKLDIMILNKMLLNDSISVI